MDKTNIYIQKAIEYLGKDIFENLHLSFVLIDGNRLNVERNDKDITISYSELPYLFYGLTIVKQKKDESLYKLNLKPKFLHTGLMHDCSRNGALNISYLKEMIMLSALMGLNQFMLYTEDVYEIDGEPYFGFFRGKYTKAELIEIIEYAEGFGVEIIPCIQTLSHLSQALRWRTYDGLIDSPNTLLVSNEKVYELIEKMIKTCAENFHSKNIHIGMDEAYDLGLKEFLSKSVLVNKKELMLNHLRKVVDICHRYNLHPMMWEDMFFKLDKKATPDWYNFEGELEDDIKTNIPEDLKLVYWDYYHKDIQIYDKMFEASLNTKREVIFAGAVISWIGFMPNFEKSLQFSSLGLKSAINHNVKSSFMLSWGDGGNECSASSLYPLIAQQCLFNFYGESNNENLSSLLLAITGHNLSDWIKLQLPNTLRNELLQFENPSKAFLYQDVLLGLFDKRVKDEFSFKYKNYASELKNIANKENKFSYVFNVAYALCECLSHKVIIGKNIRKAYKNGEKALLKKCLDELQIVKDLITKFLHTYRIQWDIENKPFGFEVTDGRIGFLLKRIETAYEKIDEYLEGKTSSIPELEEDVLPYNNYPDDEPHCFNLWSDIVTTNKI